ncbi:ribonuclease III [Mycoplasmopsis cricetuli]|uniref:ribonuclease III n=1 Tax=Mycoplasmopsis cricetuli TaxID=171283 RepID=UPI00046ECC7B|nr:ribonuclease III [Mycoplasmopsis cricetuli]
MNFKKSLSLNEFLELHKIKPKNIYFYFQAITHASHANFFKKGKSYEQLEFLGDAILSYISSEYIFTKYNKLEPGMQTRVRATAVKTETLAEISEKLGLVDILKTGVKQTGLDVKNSIKVKADIFESMLAAIYLDQGLESAKKFLSYYIFPVIDQVHLQTNKDDKTILQEHFQSFSKTSVTYLVKQNKDKTFTAKAIHNKQIYGKGIGISKKEAEQAAAKEALSKLK